MLSSRSARAACQLPVIYQRTTILPSIPVSFISLSVQQTRCASFLNSNSNSSRASKVPNVTRESWWARRRKARNARSKISTLALDSQLLGTILHPAGKGYDESKSSRRDQDSEETQQKSNRLSPQMRRLLILCSILSMPLWGRDVLEAVIPGAIGVIILVAGKIKTAVNWTRSIPSQLSSKDR